VGPTADIDRWTMTLGEDRGEGRGDKTGLSHANMGYTAGLPAEEQRYLFSVRLRYLAFPALGFFGPFSLRIREAHSP
jgi:hypothetical protein